MAETTCPGCGGSVYVGKTREGETVHVDVNTDAAGDAPRYRMVEVHPHTILERVRDDAPGDFHPDHKYDCPAFGNGLPPQV